MAFEAAGHHFYKLPERIERLVDEPENRLCRRMRLVKGAAGRVTSRTRCRALYELTKEIAYTDAATGRRLLDAWLPKLQFHLPSQLRSHWQPALQALMQQRRSKTLLWVLV